MRRSKRFPEDKENLDRWLISYADFITLLFAFFVVMYSISSVNEGKYKILSNSLDQAFSKLESTHQITDSYTLTNRQKKDLSSSANYPSSQLNPINLGNPLTTINPILFEHLLFDEGEKSSAVEKRLRQDRKKLIEVSKQFKEIMAPYIGTDLIEMERHELWIELVLKSEILFESGTAELSKQSMPVLQKIAEVIGRFPNTLHVEGHTDNLPIKTVVFPSNWELSAARAASVVRLFEQQGIDPANMAAIGYGEHHPVADNRFEEGRFKNRRVVLVLLSQSLSRFQEEKIDEEITSETDAEEINNQEAPASENYDRIEEQLRI